MNAPAPQTRARISVIIVNYNSGPRLLRCLDALSAQTRPADEVIIIDNGSNDGSIDLVSGDHRHVTIVKAGENLGFAVANNRAAARATGDWLAFLNPDAYPLNDWLRQVEAAFKRYPEIDAFGSLQIDANAPERLDGAGDVFHASGTPYRGHYGWPVAAAPIEGECFSPCAAAAIYRKAVFDKLGGFEESFFCYCEDVDLGYRLRLSGGRALQLGAARVLHEGSAVTGRHSAFSLYHGHRNRIWTYVRNTPTSILLISLPYFLIANVVAALRCAIAGDGRTYIRALRDAAAGLPTQWMARRRIQAARKVSSMTIFSALTWSPLALLRRRADIRAPAPRDV